MAQQTTLGPQAAMTVCRDVKTRLERVTVNLQPIHASSDPVFADPRDVMLEITLAIHELEAAQSRLRAGYWPTNGSHPKERTDG